MKIVMMARNPDLYSHQRLKEAAENPWTQPGYCQHLAVLYEHRLASSADILQWRGTDRLRRRHSAYWRLGQSRRLVPANATIAQGQAKRHGTTWLSACSKPAGP